MCIFSLFALCATTIPLKISTFCRIHYGLISNFLFFMYTLITHASWSRSVSNIITDEDLKRFIFGSISMKLYEFLLLLLWFVSNIYHIECMYGVVCMWSTLLFVGYLNLVTVVAQTLWTLHELYIRLIVVVIFFSISVNLEFMELFAHFYLTDQWIQRYLNKFSSSLSFSISFHFIAHTTMYYMSHILIHPFIQATGKHQFHSKTLNEWPPYQPSFIPATKNQIEMTKILSNRWFRIRLEFLVCWMNYSAVKLWAVNDKFIWIYFERSQMDLHWRWALKAFVGVAASNLCIKWFLVCNEPTSNRSYNIFFLMSINSMQCEMRDVRCDWIFKPVFVEVKVKGNIIGINSLIIRKPLQKI